MSFMDTDVDMYAPSIDVEEKPKKRKDNSLMSYSVSRIVTSLDNLFEHLESWGTGRVYVGSVTLKFSLLQTGVALLVTNLTMAEMDHPLPGFEKEFEDALKTFLASPQEPASVEKYLPELRRLAKLLLLSILDSLRQYYCIAADSDPTLQLEGADDPQQRLNEQEEEIMTLYSLLGFGDDMDEYREGARTPVGSCSGTDLRNVTSNPPGFGDASLGYDFEPAVRKPTSTTSVYLTTNSTSALAPIPPKEFPYHYIGILAHA